MQTAITAIGMVTPLGETTDATFEALAAGRSSVGSTARWGDHGPVSRFPGQETSTSLARRALHQVLEQYAVPPEAALWVASTAADMVRGEEAYGQVARDEPVEEPTQFVWGQALHQTERALRRELGLRGPFGTFSTACSSGAVALLAGRDSVASGQAPCALVVGVDALCRTTVHGFASLGVHSPSGSRPFDRDRNGMSLGEAAVAVLIEPVDGPRAPIARIAGGAMSADAYHLSTPHPEGIQAMRAISEACAQAGVDVANLGYVSAHGTGTQLNDAMEADLMLRLCPDAPIASIKGALGHTLGAAGVVEAALAALGLQREVLLPNVGLVNAAAPLDLVRTARPCRHDTAMSVNFAFGGHNTAVVLAAAHR